FNLMRNLGGSFGIAAATTYLYRRQQVHTHILGSHVTAFHPMTQFYLRGLESSMVARGADPVTASQRAYGAVWGLVQRQASMQAFVDTFFFMAMVFLLVLPLLLLMKRPKHHAGPAAMH